jgi:hypothetical protein
MSHAQREAQVSGGKPDSPRWNAIIGSRLSDWPVVQPVNPAFTMSRKHRTTSSALGAFIGLNSALCFPSYLLREWPANRSSRVEPASLPSLKLRKATYTRSASVGWWSRSGSNRRPQACKARALPTELRPLGGPVSPTRCLHWRRQVVGPGRVERPTSRLSGVRSNHLSYEPPARMARRSRGQIPSQFRRERAGLLRHRIAMIRARSRGHRRKGRETKTAETYQGRPADRIDLRRVPMSKPGNRIRIVQARRNSESRSLERR